MTETNTKIVYSLRVHLELKRKGFAAIEVMPNPYKPKLNCWVYEETENFIKAFGDIVRCEHGKY